MHANLKIHYLNVLQELFYEKAISSVYGLLLFTSLADTYHNRTFQCQHRTFTPGVFTHLQVDTVTATHTSVPIEDDQDTHFRLVIRVNGGQLYLERLEFSP
ncbi:Bacterial protein of uncharacterised function (DUF905) [Serratia fonticola]|nr:Bacterial protein of uncharacterised function (DUF905) [Serratia fonticola]